MIIHGRNLIVKLDGTAIAGARSCELNVQSEELEVSSSTQNLWREFIAGRKEWTVNCGHLVMAIESNVDMVGRKVTLSFGTRNGSEELTGSAIVKNWKVTGTLPNLSQGSFQFRGSGALLPAE